MTRHAYQRSFFSSIFDIGDERDASSYHAGLYSRTFGIIAIRPVNVNPMSCKGILPDGKLSLAR